MDQKAEKVGLFQYWGILFTTNFAYKAVMRMEPKTRRRFSIIMNQ